MSLSWTPTKSDLEKGLRGLQLGDVACDTIAISTHCSTRHAEEEPLVTPIYHSTTYRIPSLEHYMKIVNDGGNLYIRLGNPTCQAAEATLSALEGGAGAMVFTSGMAAISTVLLTFLKAGDHVIACLPVYSGTQSLLEKHLSRYNVEVSWSNLDSGVEGYRELMKSNTRMLYGETPCNPLTTIIDLEAFGQLGNSVEGLLTVVDSTYAPPCIQRPHQYGIDVVIHSGTKYLSGHSDVLAGVASTRTLEQWQKLNVCRTTLGTVLSPHDASLLLRGVKTLPLRMERHCRNAEKVAEFLASHQKVNKVYYPGLATDKGYEVAKKQMKMFGGMVALR
ncbi:hypothetical protein LSH36_331g01020 [Paralvinella palmiformis]|uniref:Uncharacterized protein n=1 Tax=Paralvinella palmiformis TaxID=53620 RepID=A0AAD9N274_9ANNE|nr:hypothetical protein LSH36_331g01020 [Paralvinella palmiformis]